MNRTRQFFCLLLLWSTGIAAQRLPDYGLNRTRLTAPDGSAQLIETRPAGAPRADETKTYYWYSGGRVHTTQGGYSGKLLSGPYQQFDGAKNLRERGAFSKGLKSGTWKTWNEDGSLSKETTWKLGSKEGTFRRYDREGRLIRAGCYRGGLLSGKVLVYSSADSVKVLRYKNGRELARQDEGGSRPSFFRRLWPFGRKQENEDSVVEATKGMSGNTMPGSNSTHPSNNPAPTMQPVGTPAGINAIAPAGEKEKKPKKVRAKKGKRSTEPGAAVPAAKP